MATFRSMLNEIEGNSSEIARLKEKRAELIARFQEHLRSGRTTSGDSVRDFTYAWSHIGLGRDQEKMENDYRTFTGQFTQVGKLFLIENDWQDDSFGTRYLEPQEPSKGKLMPPPTGETITAQFAGVLTGALEFRIGEGKLLIPCGRFAQRESRLDEFRIKDGPLDILSYVVRGVRSRRPEDFSAHNMFLSFSRSRPDLSELRVYSGDEVVREVLEAPKVGQIGLFDKKYGSLAGALGIQTPVA